MAILKFAMTTGGRNFLPVRPPGRRKKRWNRRPALVPPRCVRQGQSRSGGHIGSRVQSPDTPADRAIVRVAKRSPCRAVRIQYLPDLERALAVLRLAAEKDANRSFTKFPGVVKQFGKHSLQLAGTGMSGIASISICTSGAAIALSSNRPALTGAALTRQTPLGNIRLTGSRNWPVWRCASRIAFSWTSPSEPVLPAQSAAGLHGGLPHP